MERILVLVLILFSSALHAQMPIKEADSLMKLVNKRLALLDPGKKLTTHYVVNQTGVQIYASVAHVSNGWPEYTVKWSELGTYRSLMNFCTRKNAIALMLEKKNNPFPKDIYNKFDDMNDAAGVELTEEHPLNNYRIVIDPGHIADDLAMGKIEQKYLEFTINNRTDSTTTNVELIEGKLTWQTAVMLKARLEKAGATVLMTRKGPGLTAFGKTFEQWKKDDYQRTLDSLVKVKGKNEPGLKLILAGQTDDRSIFRYVFRDAELRKRSELINAWKPDFTVMIHYNVDETNIDWKKTTPKNFCMAFTGGGFGKGDLSDSERRFDFLRMMLMNDLDRSITLSANTTEKFTEQLQVPLAKKTDATYLTNDCVYTGKPGVYGRNIALTRLVQGCFVYGETLYQDNATECMLLMKTDWKDPVSGIITSERLGKAAEAYYQGILKTVGNK